MELSFYYRERCDLCDAMRNALAVFSRYEQPISWREFGIAVDIDLVRRYDARVPVLCLGDSEICHFFFDEAALRAAMALA